MMGRPEAVTYSGPTYIAIRSAKHDSSTATSHALDLENLFKLENFKSLVYNENNEVKPVLILSVDGGPDENPRYQKVISHAISSFLKYDLDGFFIFTNAPGRSAYNRVERRMAPLSKELSGVILEHNHYGSHLDSYKKTIDYDLELRNFKYAGNVLADIWNDVIIDNHPVFAEFIEPSCSAPSTPDAPSPEWYSSHVRESQYFLQVIAYL